MADIEGTDQNNPVAGTTGDDQVTGNGGNDTIDASSGNDTIFGDSSGRSGTIVADGTTTISGYNFQVIRLGYSAIEIDPTESGGTSGVSENGSLLNNATFGSTSDPLADNVTQMVAGTGNGDGQYDGDNTVSNETFFVDGVEYTYDGSAVYNNTIITFEDGTTATVSAVVFQDTAGNLYLAPESFDNADTTTYTSQPITSIQLGTYTSTTNGLNAFRVVDSWNETTGAVNGVDGDDVISGGAGSDTISGEGGNDTIDGGTEDDLIYGDSGGVAPEPIDSTNTTVSSNYKVISLGSSAIEIDPNETGGTSGFSENGGLLNNAVFGDAGNPLSSNVYEMFAGSGNGDGQYDGDNTVSNDNFWINGVEYTFDGSAVYDNTTITYEDGTTALVSAVVFQDTAGNLYLAPEFSDNADTTAYTAQPITSIQLGTQNGAFNGLTAQRVVDSWVETTGAQTAPDGDDSIDGGDGSDTIYGEGGSDSMSGGIGDDTIYGDHAESEIIGDDFTTGGWTGSASLDSNRATFDADGLWTNAVTTTPTGMSSGNGAGGGAQITLDFSWRDGPADPAASGSATFYIDYDGVNYVRITTPNDGTEATIAYFNGATGPAGPIPEDNTGSWTGFTTLTIDLPPGVADSGELEFWADTTGGVTDDFAVDNVIVTRNGHFTTSGDDTIDGGDGADLLDGGAGNDLLDGGTGVDTIVGGFGSDTVVLGNGFAGDSIIGGEDGTGTDRDRLDASAITASGVAIALTTTESGTIGQTTGGGTASFSEIEEYRLTEQNDVFDASALTDGISMEGEGGNDTMTGGTGSDSLFGGAGDDSIVGGQGDDLLVTGTGNDTLEGGEGADTLLNGAGDDSLVGGAGDDSIVASLGNDTLEGGAGNDTLIGGQENDSILGGADNDLIYGDAFAVSLNDTGTDGYAGNAAFGAMPTGDVTYEITFSATAPGATSTPLLSYAVGGDSDHMLLEIVGTNLELVTFGGAPASVDISGFNLFDGNVYSVAFTWDSATGATEFFIDGVSVGTATASSGTLTSGGSFVIGQEQDALGGGFDANQILQGEVYQAAIWSDIRTAGEVANDATTLGADGSDPNLVASWTADPQTGGMTNSQGGNDLTLTGDASVVDAYNGTDVIDGGTGSDTIYAGQGSDTINLSDGFGNDTVVGGEDPGDTDIDVLDASGVTASGITVNATNEAGTLTDGTDSVTFSEIEQFNLTDQGDSVVAFGTSDLAVQGRAGDDTIQEGNGNNTLSGGDDADIFYAGYGVSTISGGEGGTDQDTIDFSRANDAATVTFTGAESGTYLDDDGDSGTFSEIEAITGGSGADSINAGADTSSGLTLAGGAGDDTIIGGSGDDSITGGTGNDSLTGGAGSDTITGGLGADTIDGGDGDDDIVLGSGDDASGGGGDDEFILDPTNTDGPGTITIDGGADGTSGSPGDAANGDSGDILDFTGLNNVTVVTPLVDDGTGSFSGVVSYTNDEGETITVDFTEIEMVLGVPDIIVDGLNTSENMAPGYTDAQGDQIDGTDGNNDVILGNGGDDTIDAGLGDDSVDGGAGRDQIDGGAGDDTIDGGTGVDAVSGGAGDDILVFDGIENDTSTPSGGNWDAPTGTVDAINTNTTGDQSPPKLVTLDDGRTMYFWTNDATGDGGTTGEIQTRIYNADGTPATGQISLSALDNVDGFNGFDLDHLDVDVLPDGNVMLSWVQNEADAGAGREAPVFAIVEPTATSVNVVKSTTDVAEFDNSTYQSPPITTVLDDGNVMFVWYENGISDDSQAMTLHGRIYDPVTDTLSSQFDIGDDGASGTIAIDGTDSADVPVMDITQLAGGNVVVSYARSNIETGGTEPVFTILDAAGNTLQPVAEFQETDTTTWESPPQIVAMDDGNFMGIWVNDGYNDNGLTMKLQGRIFDADGNPLTGDIDLNGADYAVDGFDGYDIPTYTIDQLDANHIVVSYVNNTSSDGTTGGGDDPHFTILNVSDPTNPSIVVQDVPIAVSPDAAFTGPALIEPLGDSGYFVAIYGDGNAASGGAYGLNYRVFDVAGNPLTGDVPLTANDASGDTVSGSDAMDWSSVDVEYNALEGTFTVGWVGTNDGDGTGVFSSGPIDVSALSGDGLPYETATGGETGETTGDTLDLSGMTDDLTVVFSEAEAGTATETATGDELQFSEIENVRTGSGADLIDATAATTGVNVATGDGQDTLQGGAGDDTLDGGAGSDTLDGGAGADVLTGGDGPDVFIADGTADTITDFDTTTGIDGGVSTDNDFVDLSAIYNPTTLAAWNAANPAQTYSTPLEWMRADQADGTLDEAGGLQIQRSGSAVAANELNAENTAVVCFTAGTMIETETGQVPVEALQVGSRVRTLDNGYQTIRWIGKRQLSAAELRAAPHLRPIRISGGTIGLNDPARDLVVSPQHRLLLVSEVAARMFGTPQVLIPANKLLNMRGVSVDAAAQTVTYVHFLCDRHEIVFANGVPAESLYLGEQALRSLSHEGREEVHTLFPETAAPNFSARSCRQMVQGKQAANVVRRLAKNEKVLVESGFAGQIGKP